MQSSFRTGDKLEGVLLADTLILPEKVELTNDLVIITNSLVFEGSQPVIEGYGKNVYIFPVNKTFLLGKSFEDAYVELGKPQENLPEINQRTSEKFTFEEKTDGGLTIMVNGEGNNEWLKRKSLMQSQISVEQNCPRGAPICNGESGGQGTTGNPGTERGTIPPPPFNGPDGRCDWRAPNGLDGSEGADGMSGPDNAGAGGQGRTGGMGGAIEFSITI
jgi:hypothetical protein